MAREKSKFKYYPEEELIDYVQCGVFGWVDYVLHYSEEWREEFTTFLAERGMEVNDKNALAYIAFKEDILEDAMEQGLA